MPCVKISLKGSPVAYGPLATAYYLKQAAKAKDIQVKFEQLEGKDVTVDASGSELTGSNAVARYLARQHKSTPLYGGNPILASQVDDWLDFVKDNLLTNDFKAAAQAFDVLNTHLKMRSFFVGYQITVADLAVWGALKGNAAFTRTLKSQKIGTYLTRWFNFISAFPYISDCLADYEKAVKANTVKAPVKEQGFVEIQLPDAAEGKVVTRFPPEPSGYLHIGHAKAALLNDYFARLYKGKLIVRFDDTNPSKEKMEFEQSIQEDLGLIGIKGDVITHTSDHFDTLYKYAIELIKRGKGYVDDTDQETMRAQRMDGIESKCRNQSVEENLRRFEEMTKGTEFGLTCCLRAKIDMQNLNKALRDPVMYRCNLLPHHKTGNKWKVYPTYDFACPIVDSLEGVTHALRTNEYRDRNPQYSWVIEALGLRKVHIWDYSRLNFVYTLLSKRKLTWFVDNKHVTGWDDARFPTIRGIRRRGMTVEALRQFIIAQGATQKDILLEWDKIWTINKKVIDPIAPRHAALNTENLVKVDIKDDIKVEVKEVPLHKKNPDVGTKHTVYSRQIFLEQDDAKEMEVNEEVTLMDWGNAIVETITKSESTGLVTGMVVRLNLDGDFKKTKKKLTWLSVDAPQPEKSATDVVLIDLDFLITKKKLEENDTFEDFLTPVTEFRTASKADWNVRKLKKGDIIQFERKGYYICDKAFDASNSTEPAHFIVIPDGRVATTSSKAANAAAAAAANGTNATASPVLPKKQNPAAQGQPGSKKAAAPAKVNGVAKAAPVAAPAPSAPAAKGTNTVGSMYAINPFYTSLQVGEPEKISKMYKIDSVYKGFDEAFDEIFAKKK